MWPRKARGRGAAVEVPEGWQLKPQGWAGRGGGGAEARVGAQEPEVAKEAPRRRAGIAHAEEAAVTPPKLPHPTQIPTCADAAPKLAIDHKHRN